jgi:hypothetical protein
MEEGPWQFVNPTVGVQDVFQGVWQILHCKSLMIWFPLWSLPWKPKLHSQVSLQFHLYFQL